jgi:hypothetical protein
MVASNQRRHLKNRANTIIQFHQTSFIGLNFANYCRCSLLLLFEQIVGIVTTKSKSFQPMFGGRCFRELVTIPSLNGTIKAVCICNDTDTLYVLCPNHIYQVHRNGINELFFYAYASESNVANNSPTP